MNINAFGVCKRHRMLLENMFATLECNVCVKNFSTSHINHDHPMHYQAALSLPCLLFGHSYHCHTLCVLEAKKNIKRSELNLNHCIYSW
jgi:hypothetical protein